MLLSFPRRIELIIILFELGGWVDEFFLVQYPALNRQHVKAKGSAKGEFLCKDFDIPVQGNNFKRPPLIGEYYDTLGCSPGEEMDTEEGKKFNAVSLRNEIGPIVEIFRKKRKDLDHRNARIAFIKTRPFPVVHRNPGKRLP